MPKYSRKIVVFIDVLGVRDNLLKFEKEALANDDNNLENYYESRKLNKFISIFKKSTLKF